MDTLLQNAIVEQEHKQKEIIELFQYIENNKCNFDDIKVVEFYSHIRHYCWQIFALGYLKAVIEEADKNNSCAQAMLGHVTSCDGWLQWLIKAGQNNNPNALYMLAIREPDEKKSAELLKQSADKGYLKAMLALAYQITDEENKKAEFLRLYGLALRFKNYYKDEINEIENKYPGIWFDFFDRIKKLEEENEELKIALHFAPGHDGAKEAERDFEKLVGLIKL